MDEIYKEEEDNISLHRHYTGDNYFKIDQIVSYQVKLPEEQLNQFYELILEYTNLKQESEEYTSIKPIFKFLKSYEIIISFQNDSLYYQYFDFDERFIPFVLILLNNIHHPSSQYEFEKSLKTLPCFMHSQRIIKLIEENKVFLLETLIRFIDSNLRLPTELVYVFFKYFDETQDT